MQFQLPFFLICVVCLATPVALEGFVSGVRGLRRGTLRARHEGRRLARFSALFALFPLSVFLVTSLWAETNQKGIRVTIFSPGRVRTNISYHALLKDG